MAGVADQAGGEIRGAARDVEACPASRVALLPKDARLSNPALDEALPIVNLGFDAALWSLDATVSPDVPTDLVNLRSIARLKTADEDGDAEKHNVLGRLLGAEQSRRQIVSLAGRDFLQPKNFSARRA